MNEDYKDIIAKKAIFLQEWLNSVRTRAKPAPVLKVGTEVAIINPVTKRAKLNGVIVGQRDNGKSYWVKDTNGDLFLRNVDLLKQDPNPTQITTPAGQATHKKGVTCEPAFLSCPAMPCESQHTPHGGQRSTNGVNHHSQATPSTPHNTSSGPACNTRSSARNVPLLRLKH